MFAHPNFVDDNGLPVADAADQAQAFLEYLQDIAPCTLTYAQILPAYNEFALLIHKSEPLPWDTFSRHFSALIRQPGQKPRTYEWRLDPSGKVKRRTRVYRIPLIGETGKKP